jgi:hypothetical protein
MSILRHKIKIIKIEPYQQPKLYSINQFKIVIEMFQLQRLVLAHMSMCLKLRSVAYIYKLLKDTIFLSTLLNKKDT